MTNLKQGLGIITSVDDLTKGDVLLVRIRKIHKNVDDPKQGFKPSIEVADFIDNPFNPVSAIVALNSDDDRFVKQKPRYTFQPAALESAISEGWLAQQVYDKLEPSKGIEIENQKEGVHFITVNYLNPHLEGKRLRVQILETTETNRKGGQYKLNPKTGRTIYHMGKPVYVISQIAFEGDHESVFLKSDAPVPEEEAVLLSTLLEETPAPVKPSINLND